MIKNFKNSNTYHQILNNNDKKTITIPYHIDTGILVSKQNLQELIEKELEEYSKKVNLVKYYLPNFNIEELNQKLTDRITSRLDKSLLKVEYAYINSTSIDETVKEIENLPNFVEWCID